MAINIDNIFKATALSTRDFLIVSGQGCYIPAYQRPYSWDKDNVQRLFEDAVHGMDMLFNRADTISFLGTVIAIHDTKHASIKPIYKSEVASKVMTIIDGQQRLCTLAMINIALHDVIRRISQKFAKSEKPQDLWIHDEAQRLLPELLETVMLDMRTGDEDFRFYPRIIRAYDDAWSRKKSQAQYESPIARLIWAYFIHQKNEPKKRLRHDPKDAAGQSIDKHKSVAEIYKFVERFIMRMSENKEDVVEFPDLLKVMQSKEFMETLWGVDPNEIDEVVAFVTGSQSDTNYSSYCQLLRLLVTAKYMNQRMAFTVVTTESEDDAFDMFEALNTTGEPLTAFETFKPKIIETETLDKYENSKSHECVVGIESYLDQFRKAEQKQKATSEMLVPFALAETGRKLEKRLSEQRRYLRDQFEGLNSDDQKRLFVERLSHIAGLMKSAWDIDRNARPSFANLALADETAFVAFEGLRAIKHHITIAPLSRFYSHALLAPNDEARRKRTQDLGDAIKATAAFSFIWRGAFGGTENIDSHYREIMRFGFSDEGEPQIPPMATRPEKGTGAISLANYKKALNHLLSKKGEITTKEEWVKKASLVPIYRHSKDVARFLLFCASNDATPDGKEPGLIQRGRRGFSPMMTVDRWHDANYFTVEHIAPQNNDGGWDEELFKDVDTIHTLGNLILLPSEENSIAGNRSWQHKQLIYRILSSVDNDTFQKNNEACKAAGLNLGKKAQETIDNSSYLGMCSALSMVNDGWSLKLLESRSERICELAWDALSPWLSEAKN